MGTAKPETASRRTFLAGSAAFVAAAGLSPFRRPALARSDRMWVTIENFSTSGKSLGSARTNRVVKTEAQWRAQLSPISFEVTRHSDTERPFAGTYWNDHADGLYRCVCCNTALFDSRTKFESGTGWPSFYQPISKRNVVENDDYSLLMKRIAVSCARCDAHLGHVFEDGPKPTGLRYCINSAALKFFPRRKDNA